MYIDIHTDHGKHVHIEFHYGSAFIMWLKKHNLLHKAEQHKLQDSTQVQKQQNFHADQSYQSRHYRGPIGPL